MKRGEILSESDNANEIAQTEAAGRVLYERFLVEHDLTDSSIGNGFSALAVKDLKNFCRDVTFKTLASQPQPIVGGPTFQHVCEALIRLRHPNIEEVLETGMLFDGRPYAVTVRPAGRTLAEVVREAGRMELARVSSIVEQVAEALAAAHSKKILHCDVRPSNVVVTETDRGPGKAYLINFGAAWPVDVRGATLENLQADSESLSYAAPELHTKLGHRSTASDIFSLAAVAYRLIAGRVPFAGEDRVSLLRAISEGRLVRPTMCRTDLPNEAENLILSALQFEPAWRPQDADDFGVRLARALRPAARPAVRDVAPAPEPEPAAPLTNEIVDTAVAAEASRTELRRVFKEAGSSPRVSDRAVALTLITLLLAGALSIPISQTLMAEERTPPAVSTMQQRPAGNRTTVQITYWFEPQPGENADAVNSAAPQLALSSDTAGGVLVIGETEREDGTASYRITSPAVNNDVIEAGKPLLTSSRDIGESERLWIVWTPTEHTELADLRRVADAQGIIPEGRVARLRHFLERNRNLRVTVSRDGTTGRNILIGSGERLVYRIERGQK